MDIEYIGKNIQITIVNPKFLYIPLRETEELSISIYPFWWGWGVFRHSFGNDYHFGPISIEKMEAE